MINGDYRFGFNGKENDGDWTGSDTRHIQDYGFRLYNPAIAKFLSVDPLAPDYPYFTPYQFAGNNPVRCVDLDGLEGLDKVKTMQGKSGQWYVHLNLNARKTTELTIYNKRGFRLDPNTRAYASIERGLNSQGWQYNGEQMYKSGTMFGNQDGYQTSGGIYGGKREVAIIVPVDVSDINTIYTPQVAPIRVGTVLLSVNLNLPEETIQPINWPAPSPAPSPTPSPTPLVSGSLGRNTYKTYGRAKYDVRKKMTTFQIRNDIEATTKSSIGALNNTLSTISGANGGITNDEVNTVNIYFDRDEDLDDYGERLKSTFESAYPEATVKTSVNSSRVRSAKSYNKNKVVIGYDIKYQDKAR